MSRIEDETTTTYDATIGEGHPVDKQPVTLETKTTQQRRFKSYSDALKALKQDKKLGQAARVLLSASAAGSVLYGLNELYRGTRTGDLRKTAKGVLAIGATIGSVLAADEERLGIKDANEEIEIIGFAHSNARKGIGKRARTSISRY